MYFTEIGPKPMWNSTYTDKLRHDLLLNYDKFARPSQHYNVTTVTFGLSIKHLEVNEFKSTMTLHTYLQLVSYLRVLTTFKKCITSSSTGME